MEENRRVDVRWDREAYPYLAEVVWSSGGPLTLLVQSRDQRTWQVLTVDDRTGSVETIREDRDEAWLEIVPGAPHGMVIENPEVTARLLLDFLSGASHA